MNMPEKFLIIFYLERVIFLLFVISLTESCLEASSVATDNEYEIGHESLLFGGGFFNIFKQKARQFLVSKASNFI